MKEYFCNIYYIKKTDEKEILMIREALLKEGFQRSFQIPYKKQLVEKGIHGKPLYKKEEIYFSISHTREMVAVACANLPIGVDIEQPRKVSKRAIERSCSKKELEQLKNVTNIETEFLKYWTLKESYVKMTGDGMSFPFSEVEFEIKQIQNGTKITSNQEGFFAQYVINGGILAICLHNMEYLVEKNIKVQNIVMS